MDLLEDVHTRWLSAMRAGDFESAWKQTDRLEIPRRRAQKESGFAPRACHLLWDGSSWQNRRVLIRCLHGLGDTVQFIRYLPMLRKNAADTMVLAQPQLLSLLRCTASFGPILDGWTDAPFPDHDLEVEVMELPYAFRSTLLTLPSHVPYFNLKQIRDCSQIRLPSSRPGRVRVGLIWASSKWDSSRSITIEYMKAWQELKSVSWFSLQKDAEQNVSELPIPLHCLADQTQQVEQLAAAMLELDLIISVDTMTAHLAGALGRPVWLLLSANPDWRWQNSVKSSQWYPTMQIFRCPKPGDWGSLAREVAQALSQISGNRS